MPAIIKGPPAPGEPPRPLVRRIAWFLGLALCAGAATAAVALALEALLPSH
jgi:hypothetical protein